MMSNGGRYKASRWDSEPWSSTFVVTGLTLLAMGFSNVVFVTVSLWTRRTTADCARECDRSEICVVLQNEAVHREVRFKIKNSTVGKASARPATSPSLAYAKEIVWSHLQQ